MVYFLVTRFLNKHCICNEIASITTFPRNDKNRRQKLKSLANAMRRSMKRDLERGFAEEGMEKVMPYMTFGYLNLL